MTLIVPFPNMQSHQLKTCGNDPRPQTAPTIAPDADGRSVDITWTANGDETGGERDIVAYLLWRRPLGTTDWGTALHLRSRGESADVQLPGWLRAAG